MSKDFKVLPLLVVILLIAFAYSTYQHISLVKRIEKIENKLGGSKKINCNENDTVKRVRQSVVRVIGGEGEGSGFAIRKDGYILTNFHVIESEPAPKVVLPDNTFQTGEVVMADKDADLAVIKIKNNIPVLNFVKLAGLTSAEELLAIGYPLGGGLSGESFVIRGAYARTSKDKMNNVKYLLTDMTLISGISGGPMVNICGDVVGVNTAGLESGGLGIAISSDSVLEKYRKMSASKQPLKDVQKMTFQPNKNPLEAVRSFYNYLKARKLEKAFELLSDNFVKGYSFEHWAKGYRIMLDTSVVSIKTDKKTPNRIKIKLTTKDLIDDEVVYKFFEGYWDVKRINGKWLLWAPKIVEVKEPAADWMLDAEKIAEIEAFLNEKKISDDYKYEMYKIAQEAGNEDLSMKDLYERATVK